MNFTLSTVARSLAAHLSPHFPDAAFYENPNQQGTHPPCMFLQQRYSNIKLQTGGRWMRTIGLDLTYLEDYNLTDLQQRYQAAAEALDLEMETFLYTDGAESALIRTYDRQWTIDLDALHYKFELRAWVSKPTDTIPIESMDYTQEVV